MKLRRISLQYFRQHHSTDLEFRDGLVGIIGANGSGKTTLIEAIGYALFGVSALRGRAEEARTRGAGRGQKLSVELEFEHDGTGYRIERGVQEAKILAGAEILVEGVRAVNQKVEEILGMSFSEFIATYATEQKGLAFLSGTKGATERQRFILRMLGFELIEKMQEEVRVRRRDSRVQLVALEGATGSRTDLEAQLEQEKENCKELKREYEHSAGELKKMESDLALEEKVLARLTPQSESYRLLREQHSRVEERVSESKHSIERCQAELAKIEEKLGPFVESGAESAEVEGQLLASLRAELETIRATYSDARSHWISEQRELEGRLAVTREQLVQFQAENAELLVENDRKECPTCGQELGENYQGLIERTRAVIEERRKSLAGLERKLKALSVEPDELGDIARREKECRKLILEHEERFERLEQGRNLLAEEKLLRRTLIEKQEEFTARERECQNLQKKINELGFDEKNFTKVQARLAASKQLLQVKRLQHVKVEGKLQAAETLLKRTKQQILDIDERLAEGEALKRELLTFEEADVLLTQFRHHVNVTLRPRLAELASEFLADLTDGRYVRVDLAEDFTPTVVEDGEAKPVISGGEQDILNLCMRLALSHMLAERAGHNFSLLLLDEVFGSLDDQRRSNVLELLDRLGSRFEQILVITHLEDVKEGVGHLVSVHFDEASGKLLVEEGYPLENFPSFEESEGGFAFEAA